MHKIAILIVEIHCYTPAMTSLGLTATLLFLLLPAPGLRAQNTNGELVGSIQDPSGAFVSNVTVTVTNSATNQSTNIVSTASGSYSVPNLLPGTYSVRFDVAGFKSATVNGVTILPNRSFRQDVRLEVGTVQQTVEVEALAPVLNTENATIGNIMQSQQITTVPLNGRFLDRLIRISAGVTSDSASNPRVSGSSYWGGMNFNVDGGSFNDPGNGGGAYSYRHGMSTLPSVDAVSEFKIDSNSMKAEMEGSASVTITTKSGGNEFHGSLFYFNRNRATAARNFFSPIRPGFNRNEYGVMGGGPIIRNRTFFFGGYEGLKERAPTTYTLSVATADMRAGNFAGLPTLTDPLSGNPFPNNQVPTSRIDSRAAALIGYVPLPNGPGNGPAGTQANFIEVRNRQISDINRYFVRLDHRFNERDALWFSGNISNADPYFVAQAYPAEFGQWGHGGNDTMIGNLAWNHTFSGTRLNEARFTYTSHAPTRLGINRDFDPSSIFPSLQGPFPIGGLPNVNVTSHVSIGDYGGSPNGKQLTRQFTDHFTMILGVHTVKAGVDIGNYRMSNPPGAFGLGTGIANNAAFGRFDFNGRFTRGSLAVAPGHAFADFLLGYPNFTYRSSQTPVLLSSATRYSAYLQDDWRVTPRFTLSYGVRYMVQTLWPERDNVLANFDFATNQLVIPASTLPAQGQQRLFDAYPTRLDPSFEPVRTDWNNFQPRVGLAFRPFGNNKTVIRAGAGMFANFLPYFIGFRQLGFTNPPFLLAETFESTPGNTPSLTLANPFPGAGSISANPSISIVQQDLQNSVSQQWNFTIEREIVPSLGVRASYVGNKTSNLPYYNANVNLPAQGPGAIQPRRPYQPWSDILMLRSAGDSTLHQLQLEAIRRFKNGVSFQIEYSWNRSLDNTPVVGGTEDPYNFSRDRGNSDQIRRHIFTAAYTWELPFGRGRLLGSGPLQRVVSGWQIAGITYLRSGVPFSVTFSPGQTGWYGNRADVVQVGALPRGERSISRWFDPSGYRIPEPFAFGNASRNHLFGPGDIVFDMSVLKDTAITDRLKLQLRFEFFNMPNHPNFNNPAANISTTGSVGRITSAGDPRQIQFGAKVLF